MEEFSIIYKILGYLRRTMDHEEIDVRPISAENLGISKAKWSRLMRMLVKEGYIEGVTIDEIDCATVPFVTMYNPTITLKGLEYLENNSMMAKAKRFISGVTDTIEMIKP